MTRDKTTEKLKSVNFQLVLFDQATVDQQFTNILSLVSLKLENFTVLGMINYSPVASELLLCDLYDLLEVVLVRQALDCGESLAAVPLLYPHVDQSVLH